MSQVGRLICHSLAIATEWNQSARVTNQLRLSTASEVDEEAGEDDVTGKEEWLHETSGTASVAIAGISIVPSEESISISIDSMSPLQFSSSTRSAVAAESAVSAVCFKHQWNITMLRTVCYTNRKAFKELNHLHRKSLHKFIFNCLWCTASHRRYCWMFISMLFLKFFFKIPMQITPQNYLNDCPLFVCKMLQNGTCTLK